MAWWAYAGGAAALAGLGYLFWPEDKARVSHPGDGKQPKDHGPGDVPAAPPLDAEGSTSALPTPASPAPSTPETTGFHPGPGLLPAATQSVGLRGRAAEAARALYEYLQRYGNARNDVTHKFVLHFQRRHNSDPLAIRLAGRLPTTGHFDARTAATLAMYTQNPIPASPDAPRPPAPLFSHVLNPNIPGNAALTGYAVALDLRRRGVVGDERQRQLIRDYQREVNRDPKFPGPAWARETRPVISSRIRESGRYTPETARALSVQTHGAPPPPARE